MTQTLLLILGSSLAVSTLGWTYHYSSETMNWTQARQYCLTHYTDLVVIQNQKENDYLVSMLPNRTGSPYYWIGITKTHMNETWTWVGNNSTWIGEQSWAENEPNNNHSTEFCVEIYVNTGRNRGKWNDEKCNKRKFAACYKAQCNATSCSRGRCQETIDNITCLCEPGFKGDRCQTAIDCPSLSHPDNGHISCSGGNQTFNSTCRFKCHLGFLLIGSSTVNCEVTGNWSGPRPTCASYKHALMAVAGCGAFSAFCCICFCWMKHRKRKKLTQVKEPEEVHPSPSSEVHD
ncbi:L-selectin-like isoform X2 [Anabas testudineus]|uniref:L-selectin-like isoform X2 n=1 Tax=Anabas testudineus TaxID=64144 RepID=UPI000E45750F|nr:L-selectin-like isoform X2 [Anabas testudineus]